MPAYLIGHIKIIDPVLWESYVDGVRNSLAHCHAKVLFRGKLAKVLAGEHQYDLSVVIEFTDQAELEKWYYSADYQALVPLRNRAADVLITSFDSV